MKALLLILFLSISALAQDRVLVNLVNFQDDQRQPYTVESMRTAMDTVDAFYREMGSQGFTVEIRDWQTLPINRTCEQGQIGGTVAGYDKVLWVSPFIGCYYGGTGYANGVVHLSTDNLSPTLIAHELGHTYNLSHSAALDCYPLIFCTTAIDPSGDVWDSMGGSGALVHFNIFQKEKMGILTVPEVGTGTYTLTTHRGIKIRRPDGMFYYVEFRRPVGFDAFLERYGIQNGVAVRVTTYTSFLLDMTPETRTRYDSLLTGTYSDGETSISVLSLGESAVVSVQTAAPEPAPSPTPDPTPKPCQRYNPKGKCIK